MQCSIFVTESWKCIFKEEYYFQCVSFNVFSFVLSGGIGGRIPQSENRSVVALLPNRLPTHGENSHADGSQRDSFWNWEISRFTTRRKFEIIDCFILNYSSYVRIYIHWLKCEINKRSWIFYQSNQKCMEFLFYIWIWSH